MNWKDKKVIDRERLCSKNQRTIHSIKYNNSGTLLEKCQQRRSLNELERQKGD